VIGVHTFTVCKAWAMNGPEPQKTEDNPTNVGGTRRQFDPADIMERLDKRKVRSAGFKRVRLHIALTGQELAILDARRAQMSGGRGMSRSAFLGWLLSKGGDVRRAQRAWSERGHEEGNYVDG
jgi:hypothetical protein